MTLKTGVIAAVVALALGFIVYRSCAGRGLNVDPHAREAKRRWVGNRRGNRRGLTGRR